MIKTDIETKLKSVVEKLKKDNVDLQPILIKAAAFVRASIDRNFAARGRWDGIGSTIFSGGTKKWTPLSEYTKQLYKPLGYELVPTLKRTGTMVASLSVRPYGKSGIVASANVPYAEIHQYGGKVTKNINVGAHSRKHKDGMIQVKEHSRKFSYNVPARPFITMTPKEMEQLVDMLSKFILKE